MPNECYLLNSKLPIHFLYLAVHKKYELVENLLYLYFSIFIAIKLFNYRRREVLCNFILTTRSFFLGIYSYPSFHKTLEKNNFLANNAFLMKHLSKKPYNEVFNFSLSLTSKQSL